MNRKLIIAIAACATLSACSTTGDPTQGGIFWSPSKAKARQAAMLSEMTASQKEVDALEAKQSKLLKQKADIQSQIRALRAKSAQTTNPAEAQELNARISALESQIENFSSF